VRPESAELTSGPVSVDEARLGLAAEDVDREWARGFDLLSSPMEVSSSVPRVAHPAPP
jgi:hypothetical protein